MRQCFHIYGMATGGQLAYQWATSSCIHVFFDIGISIKLVLCSGSRAQSYCHSTHSHPSSRALLLRARRERLHSRHHKLLISKLPELIIERQLPNACFPA